MAGVKRHATQSRSGSRGSGASVPVNPMAHQVGPEFLDDHGMRQALAGPEDDLVPAMVFEELVATRRVLAVAAFDGARMYPEWQVVDGRVLVGLDRVLEAMDGQPAWSVGLWLTTEHEQWGACPRVVLERGGDVDSVVALATETAARWS